MSPPDPIAPPGSSASPAPQTQTVLVVDDDKSICQIYMEVLSAHGYRVLTAYSCGQAMERMDEINGEAQVLVVDFGLPDGDGADFVRDTTKKYGWRPTLYVSGWTDEFWQLDDVPGRWLIMRKPVPIPKLLAAVQWLAHGGDKPKELE
ncbi:MAG TPA: response regulator [Gemmatimonadaceae bacterium]|nr:response regulator [Gemmatimonadaceae bacterium]